MLFDGWALWPLFVVACALWGVISAVAWTLDKVKPLKKK